MRGLLIILTGTLYKTWELAHAMVSATSDTVEKIFVHKIILDFPSEIKAFTSNSDFILLLNVRLYIQLFVFQYNIILNFLNTIGA